MAKTRLAKLSVEDLKREISRRQKALPKLIAKRDALNCQIAELEALGAVKPVVAKRRRKPGPKAGRPARPGSLTSVLMDVLKEKGKLAVAQAAEAAAAAGYKSKSKDFHNIVSMTLASGRQFRRVRRGVYALRG